MLLTKRQKPPLPMPKKLPRFYVKTLSRVVRLLAPMTQLHILNIHEHTERGDNESIKYAGSGSATGGCGCK
ncbi:hypothetical protein Golomagni_07165 [Golovinomyces magnicellulatus]|nr:hypothetical protein Golomagni_07165 [Golovinomyces magnicellulatus]